MDINLPRRRLAIVAIMIYVVRLGRLIRGGKALYSNVTKINHYERATELLLLSLLFGSTASASAAATPAMGAVLRLSLL